VTLLVGAILLIRSFWRLQHVNLGFEPRSVVAFTYTLPTNSYPTLDRRGAFLDSVLGALRAEPGVVRAGAAQRGMFEGLWTSDFTVEGRAPTDFGIDVHHNAVDPGYFGTIGAPIVRGRAFDPGDGRGRPLVVIVNEAFARRYFPDQDPI